LGALEKLTSAGNDVPCTIKVALGAFGVLAKSSSAANDLPYTINLALGIIT